MTERPRIYAIVNPAAGHGRGARVARGLARAFDDARTTLEMAVTPAPGEAARLAAAAVDDGYMTILAVGGDGTANEVANGMIGSSAALALYPIGKGNDLARSLGYPRGRRLRRVPQWLASEARRRTIDVGEVNGRLFLNATGVGIDGHVAERVRASERVVGQRLAYLVGSLVSIATYRPQQMEVKLDGTATIGRFLTVISSNGTYFGGGMRPAPRARLDDGELDVTVAGDLTRVQSILALVRLYFGEHENGTTIVTHRARTVEIDLERELPLQLDGEVAHAEHVSVGIRPRALDVLAAP
ncbi:MAG: diacylglycerol kinase family lipid kinase [Chloroflexota bacterium]|nr:diacylglycerol kinase family lipid kinase [Chloroflexota bacterium]